MRIALLAPDLKGRSGWSRYALDLTRHLIKNGHHVEVIVSESSDDPHCTEHVLLQTPHRYVYNPWIVLRDGLRVRTLLKRLQPEIVHCMTEPYGFFLPLLGNKQWKTVVTLHATYAVLPWQWGGFARWFAKQSYRHADGILSVSEFTKSYVAQSMAELYRDAELDAKIRVLRNAINLPIPAHPHKKESGTQHASIISVGAVKDRKGYIQSVEACFAFRDRCDIPFTYDIYGSLEQDPVYVTMLRKRIDQLGLTSIVRLHGTVDDAALTNAYHTADLFLLLSKNAGAHVEGFGLVFLEASARGIPAIGPNTGGCPEAIAEGRSGYICDPQNAMAVAQRMEDVIAKHTIKPADCLAWARENTMEAAVQKLTDFYTMLTDSVRTSRTTL